MQRVFIGIPVDERSQLLIDELLEPIKNSRQDVRWVPRNNWHLTLAFLGNKPIDEIENLLYLFDEIYQHEARFQYRLSKLERFPDSIGRIIALTNESTASLENLFQITSGFLRKHNVEYHRLEFRPHITLGRIRKPKHVNTSFDQHINITLDISKIRFYQSTLTESGSIYLSLKDRQLN